jgi:hypothetical protein
MPKRIRVTPTGSPHDVDLAEWKRSSPLIVAGSPHNDAAPGTLQLGLGPDFSRKVCIRTNEKGELLLEFD